jgi:hypothetical protein
MDQMNNLQRKKWNSANPWDSKKILKKAKKESLEESEELVMEWLDGNTGGKVNEFLDRFLEIRTVHHVRAAKMERIENSLCYR